MFESIVLRGLRHEKKALLSRALLQSVVKAGCLSISFPAANILLREKNIAGPTERSKKR